MEDSLIVDLYFERNEQAIAETQNKYGRLCTKIAAGILKRDYLHSCKQKNRDIFTARYYFNMSVRDIAERMDMTETAVKTRLSRIRADLRAYLIEQGVDVGS